MIAKALTRKGTVLEKMAKLSKGLWTSYSGFPESSLRASQPRHIEEAKWCWKSKEGTRAARILWYKISWWGTWERYSLREQLDICLMHDAAVCFYWYISFIQVGSSHICCVFLSTHFIPIYFVPYYIQLNLIAII